MTKLIINADDFGFCKSVNYGIITAYKSGVIRSTSTMANMPGFEHAMELLKENESLGCGVHMTLSCYKPVLSNLKTIVDENGKFFRRITDEVIDKMDLDEVYEEFCAQIEKVKAKTNITHLDSHHHVHTLERLRPVIEQIVKKYDLPIRGGFEYDFDYSKVVPLIDTFYGENVCDDYFVKNLDKLKKYEIADIMCHPAYVEDFLMETTSYSLARIKEHKILTSSEVKNFIQDNFILTNYRCL